MNDPTHSKIPKASRHGQGVCWLHQHGLHDGGDHVQFTGSKYHRCAAAQPRPQFLSPSHVLSLKNTHSYMYNALLGIYTWLSYYHFTLNMLKIKLILFLLEGVQDRPPQNMLFWYIDDLELRALVKQQM